MSNKNKIDKIWEETENALCEIYNDENSTFYEKLYILRLLNKTSLYITQLPLVRKLIDFNRGDYYNKRELIEYENLIENFYDYESNSYKEEMEIWKYEYDFKTDKYIRKTELIKLEDVKKEIIENKEYACYFDW